MERLTRFVLRRRRAVLLSWLVLTVVAFVALPSASGIFSEEFSGSGEGFETNNRIVQIYGSGGDPPAIVPVIELPAGTTVDSPGVREQLARAFDRVEAAAPGARTASYASTGDRAFVSVDGRTTFGLVLPTEGAGFEAPVELGRVEQALRGVTVDGASFRVTGLSALEEGGSDDDDGPALLLEVLAGGAGALIVLGLVFGSLLALLPIIMAVVAIPVTFLALWPVGSVLDVSVIVQFLVALIGLGVAIDFALLIVMRWREERARGADNEAAVQRAMATAGSAVVFSGTTVAIGLLAMVALPISVLRSMGYGGMLIPLVSVAAAITLLPAILATVGPRFDWPRRRVRPAGQGLWFRWARLVVRRRWIAAGAGVAILLAVAIPALSIQLGGTRAESLAASGPAREGFDALSRSGIGAGALTPFEVLVPGQKAGAVASRLADVEGVRSAAAPEGWRRGGTSIAVVFPTADGNSGEGRDVLARMRDAAPEGVTIGGNAAENSDFVDAVYGNAPLMIALILALTFILLARALRSLVLPLKAIVMNLLSVAAALGIMVLVWQEGYGSEAIWGIEATGAIEAWLPILVFAFLYGLSMDYEVFILSRMREEYDRTGSTRAAVIGGLGHTGRLVTSAALILFLAFAALAASPGTPVKVFATSLAAGILFDATVVRGLLVPAAVSLMGRWNWWLPRRPARLLRVAPSLPGPEPSPEAAAAAEAPARRTPPGRLEPEVEESG